MRIVNLFLIAFLNIISLGLEAHDGTFNISGTIQDNTCELSPDSQSKIIDMGSLSAKDFARKGFHSAAKEFSVNLINCGPAASEASITFTGTPSSQMSDFYAIDTSKDAAKGLALGIYDGSGNLLPPDKASEGISIKVDQSAVEMKFFANYVALEDTVVSGSANVTVTFIVSYA
jgi:type 1 fimbria pilin